MKILKERNQSTNVNDTERWISLIGGGAMTLWGLTRGKPMGWAMALLGGGLMRRGYTGHCQVCESLGFRTATKGQGGDTTSVPYELGVRVDGKITVNKPPEEVYRFWRNVENLPQVMSHIESVKELDDNRSHWVAKGPGGVSLEWDAEIINEVPNRRIGWRSLEGSQVDNAGSVQFRPVRNGQATEVKVELQYNPPGGSVAAGFAKLLGQEPGQHVQKDLRRFKKTMESGAFEGRQDPVESESEMSFPASDAPSWSR
jgi:uncharacterized membrane protein